jgi:hypothetical protein
MTVAVDRPLTIFHLEDLKSADLIGISLTPQPLTLRLDFTFGAEMYDISLEFHHLVHQVISQPVNSDPSDPEESCFWVGNVELREIGAEQSQILSSLSYPFQDQAGTVQTSSSSLFYFRLEGDICIQVVCGSYKIFQQLESIYPSK